MISAGGCAGRESTSIRDTGSIAANPLLEQLVLRTDQLVSAMAAVDADRIRKFFPPEDNINVGRQMANYLDLPLRGMRIISWSGSDIIAEAVDQDRAITALGLTMQHRRDLPQQIPVVFYWKKHATDGMFYLVPLAQPAPKNATGRLAWPDVVGEFAPEEPPDAARPSSGSN